MKHKPRLPHTGALFNHRLDENINLKHPLVLLSELIDWSVFEREWASFFPSKRGRPALAPRLVAGILYLQHTYAVSDQEVVYRWIENPYWQFFCGEIYFQHQMPIDSSSLTRWRKRIGEEGLEWMLMQTIVAAKSANVVTEKSFEKIIVDTTVQEKAIAFPTDNQLLNKAREHMVALANKAGITLRQNYNVIALKLTTAIARHAHSKRFNMMNKSLNKLKTITGRVLRDITRQLGTVPNALLPQFEQLLSKVNALLNQKINSKNKIYALHAPEVECISKGKARIRYEFGVKVSIACTHRENLVVGMRSLPGNPYDGHTLHEAIEQSSILTNCMPKEVFIDLGYRGAIVQDSVKVYHRKLSKNITKRLKRDIKRRSAIEPIIGHMKNDGRLNRNWLKGKDGDAFHALLCGCGHNLRMILKKLRLLFVFFISGNNNIPVNSLVSTS